jgi:hypothetical protein
MGINLGIFEGKKNNNCKNIIFKKLATVKS